ncbi:MAG TPA: hypothetical protein VGL58_13990 [Caulobacteraceae bacterium]
MIVFIVTAEHTYTVKEIVLRSPGPRVDLMTYDEAFKLTSAARHTYVFADLDRLSRRRLESAAKLYRELKAAGVRVLNDPARIPTRYGMLRRLYRQGYNAFNSWRVEE